jgi:hypothetical protein
MLSELLLQKVCTDHFYLQSDEMVMFISPPHGNDVMNVYRTFQNLLNLGVLEQLFPFYLFLR